MKTYRGRFAPSPTGPLHFGSLAAALASYLDARACGGKWMIRIEDLDSPRCVPGAEEQILRTLDACGFEWDDRIERQSERMDLYADALDHLTRINLTYPCSCTRKEIADSHTGGRVGGEIPYSGSCRNGMKPGRTTRATRFRVTPGAVSFLDRLQGHISQEVEREVGDFVLRRADGMWAYQLAVVVDDAEQGITDVVRGADLLWSTPRQILLQRALGLPQPRYLHVPVAANSGGEKLSKQTRAADARPEHLRGALRFLGFMPPDELRGRELLRWAVAHWEVNAIPASRSIPLPHGWSAAGSDGSPRV